MLDLAEPAWDVWLLFGRDASWDGDIPQRSRRIASMREIQSMARIRMELNDFTRPCDDTSPSLTDVERRIALGAYRGSVVIIPLARDGGRSGLVLGIGSAGGQVLRDVVGMLR
jgi:hypothetical protein